MVKQNMHEQENQDASVDAPLSDAAEAPIDVVVDPVVDAEAHSHVTAGETVTDVTVTPFSEMTPEERFRATTRLIFIAPDVPPVPPRSRRSEFRQGDGRGDSAFGLDGRSAAQHRGEGRGAERRSAEGREPDGRRGDLRQLDELFDRPRNSRDTREARVGRDDEDRDRDADVRRSRRRGSSDAHLDDEGARTRQRVAPVVTEPQKVKGSTRLEAKKQRRRDGRDAGRRRLVITESEFLARREAVDRQMIVRTTADRVQIGVLEDRVLVEHYVARSNESSLIGNVYLGRVQNVLPSMEAAFVDIGRGRNAVLYSGEVDWSEFAGGNTARKIENALKPGDQVLVQVTKDPVGHKGARLTSQISLPGRFLVYVPGGAMNGISRKLPDTERARLKKILKEVLPSGAGVIVRTAAEGATEDQLTNDVQRLARQWESIQARVAKGGGPVLLHSEPDMLIKIIRDVFNEDFHRLIISGDETYATIENYISQVAPDLMQRVELFAGESDVFDQYRVNEQIAKALDRKVWLPSGGSLVIDRTEAMTVVDVNTGKFVGSGGNLEETVTKNNLEAAEEIVRQLRLRDVGGIIVIDFIDMVLESNRDLVLRRLIECLSRDRTKHQVAEVTSLGLVQMTRKKLGLGLLESFSEPCEVCAGRGVIVHHEPVSKHRTEAPARSNKRQKSQQQADPKSQTHSITDGAKNMLAQVAASTLPTTKEEAAQEHGNARAGAAANRATDVSVQAVTGRVQQRGSRRATTASSGQSTASATQDQGQASTAPSAEPARAEVTSASGNLLDSVLNALPDAPAAGAGRARSRRVSTAPLRGGEAQGSGSSEAPQGAESVSAQEALAQALDATAQRKAAGR